MTVSNPATLSSANAEFSGNGSLSALVRGGSFVPSNASSAISTSVAGLALSQFNGVTKPVAGISSVSISGNTSVSATPSSGGQTTLTANPVGGSGITYAWTVSPIAGAPISAGGVTNQQTITLTDTRKTNNFGTDTANISVTATSADGSKATASTTVYFSGIQ